MSIIEDDPTVHLARRILSERKERGWALAELAAKSGVSKAMLSKIERGEASPTAQLIGRVASAFGTTLANLLTEPADNRLVRGAEQPVWRDPASGYLRRQVFLSADNPLELVEIDLPSGASASFPAASYFLTRHVVWVLEGRLTILQGAERSELETGDRLEFGPPSDSEFRNESERPCRYVVAVLRK